MTKNGSYVAVPVVGMLYVAVNVTFVSLLNPRALLCMLISAVLFGHLGELQSGKHS
jgi:hypothetical protein